MESFTDRVSPEEFQAVFQLGQAPEDVQNALIASVSANPEVIDAFEMKDLPSIEVLSKSQIRKGQREDLEFKNLIPVLQKGYKPKVRQIKDKSVRALIIEWPRLYLDSDGILRRRLKEAVGPEIRQLALPSKYKYLIYTELHQKKFVSLELKGSYPWLGKDFTGLS